MADDPGELAAASAGEWEAFARLYDRHAGIVWSLCRRHSWSLEEAEDAVQETFLRGYRMLHKVETSETFGAWLYGIAKRVCAERRRAAARRSRHETRAARQRGKDQRRAPAPLDAAQRAERLERLTMALDALPHKPRLAIHLYYLDPEPIAAASEVLGVSREGFYKLLAKAHKRLARLMQEGPST